MASVGLVYEDAETAFKTGAECAALTHGAPEAYLPSGVFVDVISELMKDKSLTEAIDLGMEILKSYYGLAEL